MITGYALAKATCITGSAVATVTHDAAAGDFVYLQAAMDGAGPFGGAVTDSQGNPWTLLVLGPGDYGLPPDSVAPLFSATWQSFLVTPLVSGVDTITFTPNPTSGFSEAAFCVAGVTGCDHAGSVINGGVDLSFNSIGSYFGGPPHDTPTFQVGETGQLAPSWPYTGCFLTLFYNPAGGAPTLTGNPDGSCSPSPWPPTWGSALMTESLSSVGVATWFITTSAIKIIGGTATFNSLPVVAFAELQSFFDENAPVAAPASQGYIQG